MKKRFISIVLALVMIVSLVPQFTVVAEAATVLYSGTCGAQGDNLTWTLTSDGVLTITGTGDMEDFAAYTAYSFSIKSVNIADGVTSLGAYAFCFCDSLTSVTIPDSVTSIGNYVFYECSSLTSVTIGDSVTSIGDSAFEGCSSLTSVTIGDSVTSIGDDAFSYCASLTSVTIGDSVTSIGDDAFSSCSSLEAVYIHDLAAWCRIDFSNGASNPLCYWAKLYLNNEVVSTLEIPDSVTSIGDYAFSGCSSLTRVTIGDSVTSIGAGAFSNCSSLTRVTIPDSVTSIGNYAFYYCRSLTRVTIPDSVTSIGEYAFYYCSSMNSVTIPDSVTSIGASAFSGCSSLTGVTIPDSVTSIGDSAFEGCSSLTSVTIPDSVTSIGNYVFYECSSLSSVTIGDSVTSIGDSAFEGCSSLTSVTIGDSVTSIGDYAFYKCSRLTSVTIGDSVTSIGAGAFSNCSSLTGVTIPDSVTSIGEDAFSGCSSLTSVTIPDSVTSIGDDAFSYCDSLTSVTIPDSVTAIGRSAFYGCSRLTSVYYIGTETNWNRMTIASGNDELLLSNIYFHTQHTPLEGAAIITPPTCTTDGYTTYSCICGYKYTADMVPALDHDWDNGVVTTQPTVTDSGIKTFTCQRTGCGETRTETIPACNNPFVDVKKGAFYYNPVMWAVSNGVTSGLSATTFGPDEPCTRAQVVTFLWRAAGSPAPTSSDCPFTDVSTKGFYYKAMMWAVENGITSGLSATTFGPDEPCTRGQVVTFLWRAAGKPASTSSDCPFTDVSTKGFYYKAMMWAVEDGVTAGNSKTTFAPDATCTRGQVVTFLYRAMK